MPPQNTPPESSGKKQMNHSHVGLIAVGLVVVVAFAAISFNNKQTQLQQAATLASQEAERAAAKPVPTSTQEVKPIPGMPKIYTPEELAKKSKNMIIKVDPILDAEKNASLQSTPGFETSTDFHSSFVWVNPTAAQTLVLVPGTGTQSPQLKARHKFQIVAGKYNDAYLFPSEIKRQLVGGRENPTNPVGILNGNFPYVVPSVSMSSNASVVSVNVAYSSGGYWTTNAIKIPAGDVAFFTIEYLNQTNILYPDTYFSELGKVLLTPNVYIGAMGLQTDYSVFQDNYSNVAVMSNKTNSVTVVGETSPYILNWEPNIPTVINNAYPLTFTGVRFTSNVNVIVQVYSSGPPAIYNFTKATTPAPNGKRTFSFTPVNEGISFSPGDNVVVKVSNANGESNVVWFWTQ